MFHVSVSLKKKIYNHISIQSSSYKWIYSHRRVHNLLHHWTIIVLILFSFLNLYDKEYFG